MTYRRSSFSILSNGSRDSSASCLCPSLDPIEARRWLRDAMVAWSRKLRPADSKHRPASLGFPYRSALGSAALLWVVPWVRTFRLPVPCRTRPWSRLRALRGISWARRGPSGRRNMANWICAPADQKVKGQNRQKSGRMLYLLVYSPVSR